MPQPVPERKLYSLHVHEDAGKYLSDLLIQYEAEFHLIPDDHKAILELPVEGVTAAYIVHSLELDQSAPLTSNNRLQQVSIDELVERARNYDGSDLIRRISPEARKAFNEGYAEKLINRAIERQEAQRRFIRADTYTFVFD